ncbi:MAG: apiosidase-like domain-containing protein [Saccharofermentanales bacterium]
MKNDEKELSGTKENIYIELPAVRWQMTEISFNSAFPEKQYDSCFDDVQVDVLFTSEKGTEMEVPAFWDGERLWKVRFAPPETGKWKFKTVCTDSANAGLHNIKGSIIVAEYKGKLDIYKHGFIKISKNGRYFTYADGKPFFYLGDTHWSMSLEQFDRSDIPSIPSQFKYIVDKRVQQGFTVYQSEPIGAKYDLADGFTAEAIAGFRDLDRRFAYIAEKGLVHANAQLFFPSELANKKKKYPHDYLRRLCRYWVARYGSYPVMWTTGQETDNDFYYMRPEAGQTVFDAANNPWRKVAGWVHLYDSYEHPLTAHMEYASMTDPNGVCASTSSFKDDPGHNWFGAQWSSGKSAQINFDLPKDFWKYKKPTVNYEGLYDHLWTMETGARAQGWNAFLNGMFGHGYGAIDIWFYNSSYDCDKPTDRDGEYISVDDKKVKWFFSVDFPAAYQMGHMKSFLCSMEWWKLTPRFDDKKWFETKGGFYTISSIKNDSYVVYFYNKTVKTGVLKGMSDNQYLVRWFNPRSGIYSIARKIQPVKGEFIIGNKPDEEDWILLAERGTVQLS